jgi:phosphoribosylaminoimidazole-succinocarboxamide synthase
MMLYGTCPWAVLPKISEGKTKIVYEGEKPEEKVLFFKDDITALDGVKRDTIPGKGEINATMTEIFYEELGKRGVATHFVKRMDSNRILVKSLDMIKLEVVCRNVAAGHFVKRFPMFQSGDALPLPIVEFYWKNDELHDPLLTEDHVLVLKLASREEVERMKAVTLRVNEILSEFLAGRGFTLVDFKLEFGHNDGGSLLIGDELNCDSMRIWDSRTGRCFDKDIYRTGSTLEDVMRAYREVLERISAKQEG